jgi:hypothetical protein
MSSSVLDGSKRCPVFLWRVLVHKMSKSQQPSWWADRDCCTNPIWSLRWRGDLPNWWSHLSTMVEGGVLLRWKWIWIQVQRWGVDITTWFHSLHTNRSLVKTLSWSQSSWSSCDLKQLERMSRRMISDNSSFRTKLVICDLVYDCDCFSMVPFEFKLKDNSLGHLRGGDRRLIQASSTALWLCSNQIADVISTNLNKLTSAWEFTTSSTSLSLYLSLRVNQPTQVGDYKFQFNWSSNIKNFNPVEQLNTTFAADLLNFWTEENNQNFRRIVRNLRRYDRCVTESSN